MTESKWKRGWQAYNILDSETGDPSLTPES